MAAGAVTTLVGAWLLSPLPLVIEDPLVVNDRPVRADAIVCLSSGSVQAGPSSAGWRRIGTGVRLYKDGFAPVVIFSGGIGSGGRSEAEIYAEAGRALGLPEEAALLEPLAESTAEHPSRIAALDLVREKGGKGARLLVVTSPYHGRRTRGVFQKAGFTNVRVVTTWGLRGAQNPTRQPRNLEIGQRAIDRLYRLISAAREWAALAYYKARGWI